MQPSQLYSYRKVILIGLLVQVIAAWFSVGYNYPDEHFQVYEFANYKLGHSAIYDLAWEYQAQIRSGIQPFIAFLLCRSLAVVGIVNPFYITFVVRLLIGVFTWLVTLRMVKMLLPEFATEKGKQFFIWCSFLLWFVPYIGVRFSAENVAGLFFMLAISLISGMPGSSGRRRILNYCISGLLLGFALYLRLQISFAILGLGIYLLFIKKAAIADWISLMLSGIAAIGVCILIDYWFYGNWVFTPYHYFYTQIVENMAANWGVEPWWYYFVMFFQAAVPPLSIALLGLFFYGISAHRKHIITVACITFLLGHFFIGHKEMRFLFPMEFSMIFLVSAGADRLFAEDKWKPAYNVLFKLLVFINVGVLVAKICTPAQEVVQYYKFLYDYSQKQEPVLVSWQRSPYTIDKMEANFYKPAKREIYAIWDNSELEQIVKNAGSRPVLYLGQYVPQGKVMPGYKFVLEYCLFPDWLLSVNFNHWQDRSRIWAIYRVYPDAVSQHLR